MTRAAAEEWMRRYLVAWDTNATDDIRALFTEDAVYLAWPGAEPWVGHDAIVGGWLAHADQPDDHEFEWSVLAVDGEVAVVRCVTTYLDEGPGVYDNLFVVRLAADGRASEFTDWVIKRSGEVA